MFAFHLTAPGLDALRIVDLETPRPGHGEVLVRLRAASLNYIDLVVAQGGFPVPALPWIPVSDGAGEIAEIGPGVSDWRVGDRVVPHFLPDWTGGLPAPVAGRRMRGVNMPGSLAEYVVVPTTGLVALPPGLSFEEGATLPIAATTAWSAIRAGNVGPGSTVLILGTGGVSLFALQFAKASGARVIVTSSSDDKLALCQRMGADDGLNYRTDPDWDLRVLDLTQGRGADLVVETGGAETFGRSLNAAALEGTVVPVGFLTGETLSFPIWPVNLKRLRILGSNTGPVSDLQAAIQAMTRLEIKPIIDRSLPFHDAKAGFEALAAGSLFGKAVITL